MKKIFASLILLIMVFGSAIAASSAFTLNRGDIVRILCHGKQPIVKTSVALLSRDFANVFDGKVAIVHSEADIEVFTN